jgi:ABC-type nitrate/sulfonate/bicarbonate transport system substrate-binding protein
VRRTFRLALLAVVSAGLLSLMACAPAGTPSSSPGASTAAGGSQPRGPSTPPVEAAAPVSPAPLKRLRIATIPSGPNAWPIQFAHNRGWYAGEGLQTELTHTMDQVPALVGGTVDVISIGASTPIIANSRGADIVLVGLMSEYPLNLLIGTSSITDVRQLQNKSIGITDFASSDYAVTRRLFQNKGIDPNAVTFRRIGTSRERVAALQAGQIDSTPLDFVTTARSLASGYTLLATPVDFGKYPWVTMGVRRDWGTANSQSVIGFLRATYRAMQYLDDPNNDTDILQNLPAAADMDPAIVGETMQLIRGKNHTLFSSARLEPADLGPAYEFYRETGDIKQDMDLSRMIEISYHDAAVAPR